MSSPTNSDEFESAQEVWRREVGRLVLAFGDVEFCLCQCLVHVPPTNQWHALKDKDFKVKVNAAIRYVNASGMRVVVKRKLVKALNAAMALAKDRNLVAHNPLHLGMYTSPRGGVDFRLEIYSLRNSKITMSLERLTKLAESATRLADDFHVLLGSTSK